jgi:hypothetical protein
VGRPDISVNLAPAKPADYFDAHCDAEEDEIGFVASVAVNGGST